MVKMILKLLKYNDGKYMSKEVKIAKGINKLPENWSEVVNYIKLTIY